MVYLQKNVKFNSLGSLLTLKCMEIGYMASY